MSEIIADRVKETTTSIGTGTIALGGALVGFRKFSDVCAIGDTFYGAIVAVNSQGQPTGQWETGKFTYISENTISRTTISASSNTDNSKVNFAVGTKHVFLDITARKIIGLHTGTSVPVESGGGTNDGEDDVITPPTTNPETPILPYGRPASDVGLLTFNDDFDGAAVDTTLWHEHMWWNRDTLTDGIPLDKIKVENSLLRMRALEPYNQVNDWTWYNATLATDGSFYQKYGYIEVRAKLPRGGGPWPAIWLYNHDGAGRPEIDIMEAYPGGGVAAGWGDASFNPNEYAATVHTDLNGMLDSKHMSTYHGFQRLDNAFYHYACRWDPSGVQFYFEGKPVGTKILTSSSDLKLRMYLVLDYWLGSASGAPGANAPLDTSWNNSFDVDWVRCWELPEGGTEVWPTDWEYPSQTQPSGEGDSFAFVHSATPEGVGPYNLVATDYTLLFSDEFTGTSLDTGKWEPRIFYGEDHSIQNYRVVDGRLKIWPQADTSGVFHMRYVETRGFYARGYGFFEFMAKLPRGQGVRPILRICNNDGGALHAIEVCIALPGVTGWGDASKNATDYQMYLWDVETSHSSRRLSDYLATTNLSDSDHRYGVDWDATGIQWYFDGVAVGPKLLTTMFNGKNFYIGIGVEFGTGGSGSPSASDATLTPQGETNSLEIDYVRGWRHGGSGTTDTPSTQTFNVGYYGDSTTQGITSTDGVNYYTVTENKTKIFTDKLELLSAAHTVTNKGVSGAMAVNRLNGTSPVSDGNTWSAELAANPSYTHVIIAYGNNEMFDGGTVTAENYATKVAAMKSTLATMVDEAVAAGVKPILETPNIVQYNDYEVYFINAIRELATEKSCGLIDIYEATDNYRINSEKTYAELIPDGGHPSEELYGVMGNYAYERFVALA